VIDDDPEGREASGEDQQRRHVPRKYQRIEGEIVSAHLRSLQAGHLTDVISTDQHTVKPWFAGKLDVSPPVIDLTAQGFTLIGGRLDYVDARPIGAVVYKRRAHIINLFAWADHGQTLPASGLRDGYRMILWKQNDLDLAAVSDVDPAELDKFVALVKKSQSPE